MILMSVKKQKRSARKPNLAHPPLLSVIFKWMKMTGIGIVFIGLVWLMPGNVSAQAPSQSKPKPSNLNFRWGPFQAPTPFSPFQKLRMLFFHQAPLNRPSGSIYVASTLTWVNLWIPPGGNVFMDAEGWDFNNFVEYSINSRVAVSLFVPLIFISGGFMDAGIEGFHNTFGLGNMDREKHPRNEVHFEVIQKDGTIVSIVESNDNSLWRRAPVFSLRLRLNSLNSTFPLTLKASVDFPELETKTNIIEEDGRDWGVGIVGALNISEHWSGNISIARTQLRKSKLGDQFELEDHQTSWMFSLDYSTSNDFAYIIQFSFESAVAKGTNSGFDRPTTNFLGGCKWMLSGGEIIEFAFLENLGLSDNSADFALHGGYSFTF